MMDITQMSDEKLKALCYDQIVLLNQAQANINAIQQELAKRRQAEVSPPQEKKETA